MLSFVVYREPNRRQTASPLPTTLHSAYLRHGDEKLLNATRVDPSFYKCPLAQPLSFDILTNAPGVWGPLDFSLSGDPRKSFRSNTYGPPTSVANKRLMVKRSPLDATLTKIRGVPPLFPFSHPPLPTSVPLRLCVIFCLFSACSAFDFQLSTVNLPSMAPRCYHAEET